MVVGQFNQCVVCHNTLCLQQLAKQLCGFSLATSDFLSHVLPVCIFLFYSDRLLACRN